VAGKVAAEELLSEVEEEELDDRMFDACEEAHLYVEERWGCHRMFGAWCCDWDSEKRVVEVELCDRSLVVDGADVENLKRIIERHGLAVKRVEVEVSAGDFVAEVTIRFHVALSVAEETRLGAGLRWLFS
jgi:EAL domain-containing protein (putative c-di-GMP-specific phosphodiesterase class I)